MYKTLTSLAALTGLALASSPAAFAQLHSNLVLDGFTTVFHENFNSAPTGLIADTNYRGDWAVFTGGTGTGGRDPLAIVADTNNFFGAGTSNQVLRSDGAKGWTLTFNIPEYAQQTVAAFSFDMRHLGYPVLNSSATGTNETNRLTTRFFTAEGGLGGAPLNFGLQHTTTPTDGVTPPNYRVRDEAATNRTANPNEIVHFDVIVNNSTETFFFNNGAKSLAPGQSAVWINGVEAVSSYAFGATAGIGGQTLKSFDIRSFSNNPWAAEFDNFAVSAVPEPTTYALLFGLGALGFAAYRRLRRS
jgi:hypothetical protein